MVDFVVSLAAFAAAWGLAVVLLTTAVLVGSLVGVISTPIAAVILSVVTIFLATRAALRHQWVGVVFWLLTLGSGAAAAGFGAGSLAIWGLVMGILTAGVLFAIPAAFSLSIRSALRMLLVIQLVLSLALVAREMGWVIGGWAAFTALILLGLSAVTATGSYRPYEIRRAQRLLSRWAMVAALALLLWQPVIIPTVHWLNATGQWFTEKVVSSPLGSWYSVIASRAERMKIGEAAKTAALRDLQKLLADAHRQRWEKGIQQIPSLPLTTEEWGNLGIPREADP